MNTVSFWWLLIVVIKIISFVNANWITGNLCWSMPCMNGGSCFGSAYNYLCVCPIHYTGIFCEKRLGICEDNPCGNRGSCVEKSLTTFECRCYFDYIGRTCEEHVKKNDSSIWSSLLPVHTRILFDMLQEAYNAKSKKKSLIGSENGEIDFLDLLLTYTTSLPKTTTTTTSTTAETTFITEQIETTEIQHIIPKHNIQFDKIFPDISTVSTLDMNTYQFTEQSSQFDKIFPDISTVSTLDMNTYQFTEQSSQFDNVTTAENDRNDTTIILENITTRALEQNQTDFFNTTDAENYMSYTEDSSTIITSTSLQWSNDDSTITTNNNIESDTITTIESIDDGNNSYSSMNISEQLTSTNSTTFSKTRRSHLLYKLCQQVISHILSNTSSIDALSLPSNTSSNVLLSWLRKYLSSSTSIVSTSTISSLIIHENPTSSVPLKRIDMDDALHQMNNNNIDNGH